jgi:hypothetical protein
MTMTYIAITEKERTVELKRKGNCGTEKEKRKRNKRKKSVDGRIRTYAGETHMISSHAQ